MSQMIDRLPVSDDLVAIAERASLFNLLQQAMRRQRLPPNLPARLYDDLGIPQHQRPEIVTRIR